MDLINNYNFYFNIYNVSDSDSDEEFKIHNQRRRRRRIRARPDHFNLWDDLEFYNRFRLSKNSVRRIYVLIRDEIKSETNWNHAVSPMNILLLTLRYLATGNFIITVGDFAGVHKTTAGNKMWKVLQAIARQRRTFIKFPSTPNEISRTVSLFYQKARFPNVVGALDCTHVKIQSPGGNNAELFRNRKGFFSFNVQSICDAELKILDIVARWPGSSHDATIFNNSNIRARFEHGEFNDKIIVADSGYQNRAYCLTPIQNPRTDEENLYNESQIRTRNVVERSYGIWKRRFPILARGIQLHQDKVQCLIVATVVLHNIAIEQNDGDPPSLDQELDNAVNFVNNFAAVHGQHANENNRTRLRMVHYFNSLL